MITKDFVKNVDEMSDSDWDDVYQYRLSTDSIYTNAIDSGAKIKYYYMLSLKQEETIKKMIENDGYTVEFLDKDRRVIKATIQNHNNPDLLVDGNTTVEVKNFYPNLYRSNQYIKCYFRANVYGLDEEEIKKVIWKRNYHDADLVYFVDKSCEKCCYVMKFNALKDMRLCFKPDTTINAKQAIQAYVPASEIIDLRDC